MPPAVGNPPAALMPHALAAAVPVLSVIFVLMHENHQSTIAVLRSFLRACELGAGAGEYGYNARTRWVEPAGRYRKYHDRVAALLVLLANAVALLVLSQVETRAAVALCLFGVAATGYCLRRFRECGAAYGRIVGSGGSR